MYQKEIEAYWNDPARERELVAAISRLVGVKSVKGEAEPGKPWPCRRAYGGPVPLQRVGVCCHRL